MIRANLVWFGKANLLRSDSETYLAKKALLDRMITLYGRNVVLEALRDESIDVYKLHMSRSNKPAKVIDEIRSIALSRGIETVMHDKQALSRISKNSKQDQGVALDIVLPFSGGLDTFLSENQSYKIIALDGITNPQNLGMIIRSCAAGDIDGILLPTKGSAQISPLVIKASAGTLFKIPLLKTEGLGKALRLLRENGASLYTLDADSKCSYKEENYPKCTVFVLGNESDGVRNEIKSLCNKSISIPMKRGVESLNVAITAALLAYMD